MLCYLCNTSFTTSHVIVHSSMVGVHFVEKPSVGHEGTIVGRALNKHPPLLKAGWLDFPGPSGSNHPAGLWPSEHVTRNLINR